MKIHPFTLAFCDEWEHLEAEYAASHFEKSLGFQRVAILIAIFFYAFFGILDAYLVPEKKHVFWFIRYAVVCPFAFTVFLFSFTRHFRQYADFSLFLMFIVAGGGIDIMILLAGPPVAYSYYAGLILVLIYLYTFMRIRFPWAFAASWLMLLFYEIIAIWLVETPTAVLVNNNFFMVSGNIFCILAGYSSERAFRKNYFLNHMLDREKDIVARRNLELKDRIERQRRAEQALLKKNREIEAIVEERTAQLQESREKYRDLVERINDVVFALDETGRVTYISPVVEQMFGYSPSDLLDRRFAEFLHQEDGARAMTWLQEEPADATAPPELRFRARSGEYRWVVTSIRREAETGVLRGIRGVLRDITDVKKLEEQLRHSLKMEALGTLSGGIAHDFNNILAGIFGYCQLAQKHIDTPGKAKDKIDQISKGAKRAADLVQQILAFSRNIEYEKQPLTLNLVVKEAMKLLRSTIPTTIEIRENIVSQRAVLANPAKMHQVVMNLCTNAYQAMDDPGGVMTVSLTDADISRSQAADLHIMGGRYIKFEVMDTGHGMDPDILKRAFDPYFTTKAVGKGTGMGLSLVYAIVREHDGYIHATSTPGKGAAFTVYLPVTEKAPDREEKRDAPVTSAGGNERIMIVDDEKSILDSTRELLIDYGYRVSCYTDGLQALEAFTVDPDGFDLLLTDMTMPGMTGETLAKRVLALRPELPVILCTGFNEQMSEAKALEIGIKRFIQKPVIRQPLVDIIREVLSS